MIFICIVKKNNSNINLRNTIFNIKKLIFRNYILSINKIFLNIVLKINL